MAYQFAFNNPKYSDRTLRLVIDAAGHPHQQEEDENEDGEEEEEEEEEAAEEEEGGGGRGAKRRRLHNTQCGEPSSAVSVAADDVTEYHVNTLLLAKESLFFRRIFDGDSFKESSEKVIDIHLTYKEKEPFIDLLRYLYNGKLEASTVESFISVWHLAQRFLVDSCSELCMRMLRSLPLTFKSSCYFLELAAMMVQNNDLEDLIKRSISFLVIHFKVSLVMNGENPGRWMNFEDFKGLSATALEMLLGCDDLHVIHEESVFHAVRTWIALNTKSSLQEIDAWKKLGPLIRWPFIETFRIKALISETEDATLKNFLIEALIYQTSSESGKASSEFDSNCSRFHRRSCHALPLRAVCIDMPVKHGIVFFSLSIKDWNRLQKSGGPLCTERFLLDDCVFVLLFKVRDSHVSEGRRVSILLLALSTPPSPFQVVVSIATWDVRTGSYLQRYKGAHFMRKEVLARVIMCIDYFGKDVDRIADSDFVYNGGIWFKTDVHVERRDLAASSLVIQ